MSITRAVQPDLRKKRVNWQKVAVILLFAIVPMFLLMGLPRLFLLRLRLIMVYRKIYWIIFLHSRK